MEVVGGTDIVAGHGLAAVGLQIHRESFEGSNPFTCHHALGPQLGRVVTTVQCAYDFQGWRCCVGARQSAAPRSTAVEYSNAIDFHWALVPSSAQIRAQTTLDDCDAGSSQRGGQGFESPQLRPGSGAELPRPVGPGPVTLVGWLQ